MVAAKTGCFAVTALLLVTSAPLSAQEPKLRTTLAHETWGEDYSSLPISVAFSRDGQTLVSAGRWQIVLWDVATGRQKAIVKDGSGFLQTVAFSGDGKMLAWSVGSTVKLWDVTTAKERATLDTFDDPARDIVKAVAFSSDDKTLASAIGSTVELWNVGTGEKKATLQGHTAGVWSVSFSRDGRLLASGSKDTTVTLWDATTGQKKATLKGHAGGASSVAFSPDGALLAAGVFAIDASGRGIPVKLWDVATGKEKVTLYPQPPYGFSLHSVAFSSDGDTMASALDGRFVSLWDVARGEQKATLQKGWPGADVEGVSSLVAFSSDFKLLAVGVGGKEAKVYLWEMPSTAKADE